MERLQKFLASTGVASRRKCEELILGGYVKVNGIVITTLGTKVDADITTLIHVRNDKTNNNLFISL